MTQAERSGSEFRVMIREAQPHERRLIEAKNAAGSDLGSDHCVAVWIDARIIGWGDDYGTFHPVGSPTSAGQLEAAGEALLGAAIVFYEAEAA